MMPTEATFHACNNLLIFESSSSSEENTRDVATPTAEGPAQHVLFDSSEDDNGQRVDTAAAGMYGRLVPRV